jgi:DNA (cytosine-5)-methyltransferase 1
MSNFDADQYTVVDLFAGAGGLSLGFSQTGHFDIKVAYEHQKSMQDTYRRNHQMVDVRGDVCSANYQEIIEQYGNIDVVIGGPPCQGFSNANRQRNHAINKNNMLVKQFIRAVQELHPKAFVMENVSMLRSGVHRFYLAKSDVGMLAQIPKLSSHVDQLVLLQETYYFDGAIDLVQNYEGICASLWDSSLFSKLNILLKASKYPQRFSKALERHKNALLRSFQTLDFSKFNDYVRAVTERAVESLKDYYGRGNISKTELSSSIEHAVMIQRMLKCSKEIFDNEIIVENYSLNGDLVAHIRSFAVFDYLKAVLESTSEGYAITSGVLCAADFGAPQKRRRFVVIGVQKQLSSHVELPSAIVDESCYTTVRDAIADIEEIVPFEDVSDDEGIPIEPLRHKKGLVARLRNTTQLKNHIVPKTTDRAMQRFKALKQGENFHALNKSLQTNSYSNVERTQNTIYLRLNYDQPSGTVVNVRKSMWIHPTKDRAISIREAARLQSFPDSFVFCGSKDQQYQQVGNAVPPVLAKAIADKVFQLLSNTSTPTFLLQP